MNKKIAVAALAGLMAVGFSTTASATANPYPQGYKGNGSAVVTDSSEAKASCTAASCTAKVTCKGNKKPHHKKHHAAAPAAKAAAPAAAKPAAPAKK
jgi:hypothetical protein